MSEEEQPQEDDDSSIEERVMDAMRNLRNIPLEVLLVNAEHCRNVYLALIAQGFNDGQAIYMTCWQMYGVRLASG